MEKDIEFLINRYEETEDEIRGYIKCLRRYGEECCCGSLDKVELRGTDGSSIFMYCVECGGYIYEFEII